MSFSGKVLLCSGKRPIFVSLFLKQKKQSWKIIWQKLLTGRPYGIRLDFKHKGFALFNYNMNELGNHLPGRLETLPLEDFDVEDIPLCGERIVRKENITDIFFYDEKSNPYSDNRVDMKKLKAYNKYIYPLSLILNRNL